VQPHEIRYARSGDVNVAYTTVGDGPFDVVFVSGWVLSNLEVAWEGIPAQFYERMSSFCRLILFDKRGTGISDRIAGVPDMQTRMDDVRAVMDAVGSRRAAVLGFSEGGPLATLFAASHPERTAALVLYGTYATPTLAPDYPWGMPRDELLDLIRDEDRLGTRLTDAWCDQRHEGLAPSTVKDEDVVRWWRRWVRISASPSTLSLLSRMNADLDIRHVLPAVRVPTEVLHRVDDEDMLIEEGRYIADHIPGARMVELEGPDHGWWVNSAQIADQVRPFLEDMWHKGEWDAIEPERVLATVLFTDIVDSTVKLAEVGDGRWRELLTEHHRIVRGQLARHQGREVDTAGDGFFAAFDGPARAIRCATAITEEVRILGLEVRAGLHTGECEVVDGKIGGIAVHIGARVASHAAPGEVLVSGTVKDLVAGSGLTFLDRGVTELKGLPGEWALYAVDSSAEGTD
jgi:class 3 adenylate cyclase/predicted alpha/beta hydrolase